MAIFIGIYFKSIGRVRVIVKLAGLMLGSVR